MTDDTHSPRIAVLETRVETLDDRTVRMERTQDEHGKILQKIDKHIAEQTGALTVGKWVIGGVGTVILLAVGSLVKKLIEG